MTAPTCVLCEHRPCLCQRPAITEADLERSRRTRLSCHELQQVDLAETRLGQLERRGQGG